MKIFYTYGMPHNKLSGIAKIIWIISGLVLFFGGAYLIFVILRFIFARSIFLGLLFIFFALPALVRFLFIFFFTVLAGLLALLPLAGTKQKNSPPDGDDVIDVKYKVD